MDTESSQNTGHRAVANMKRIDLDFRGAAAANSARSSNRVNELGNDSVRDDFEHLIFDIEEIECKMTDIEERERSDESRSAGSGTLHGGADGGMVGHRSVRGSIL